MLSSLHVFLSLLPVSSNSLKLTWCLCGDRQDTSSKTSEFSWQLTACSRVCRRVHSQWVVKRASAGQDLSWTLWTFEVRMVLHIQAPGTFSVSNMNGKEPILKLYENLESLPCEEVWFDERCICFCAVRCFNTCTGGVFSVFLCFYRFLPAQDVWIHAYGGWWDHGSMVAQHQPYILTMFRINAQCFNSSTGMDCR